MPQPRSFTQGNLDHVSKVNQNMGYISANNILKMLYVLVHSAYDFSIYRPFRPLRRIFSYVLVTVIGICYLQRPPHMCYPHSSDLLPLVLVSIIVLARPLLDVARSVGREKTNAAVFVWPSIITVP